jgi:hypothetical protein
LTTEQQNALNKATNSIFIYVDNIFLIKGIYDQVRIRDNCGIASPYLNFRDALFHYKKMYESAVKGDNADVIQQSACIEEHLNRGIRDFAIDLCSNRFVPVIHEMIKSKSKTVNGVVFQRLRRIYHELKNIVAEIRLGGQSLLRFDQEDVNWLPRIIAAITDFNDLLGEYTQLKIFYSEN